MRTRDRWYTHPTSSPSHCSPASDEDIPDQELHSTLNVADYMPSLWLNWPSKVVYQELFVLPEAKNLRSVCGEDFLPNLYGVRPVGSDQGINSAP
jgi:hypothetical protein